MKPMNALQQKYFMPMKLALHQMQSLDSVNPPGMCLKLSPSTLQQNFP
jgi:hypothetical protein